MLRGVTRRATAAAVLTLAVATAAGCGSGVGDGTGVTVTDQAGATATDQAAEGGASAIKSSEPSPAAASLAAPARADAAGSVTFAGVTVTHALDTGAAPGLTSRSATPASGLLVQDLVVGTGPAATTTSTATLHYCGVLYADGTQFDANYDTAAPEPERLGAAVAGFAQGIGGTAGVPPMRVGGRRLLVFPSALGYGAVPLGPVPAHSSLVFVVDLLGLG